MKLIRIAAVIAWTGSILVVNAAPRIEIASDHTNAVYQVGESVSFVLRGIDEHGELIKQGQLSAQVDNFGPKIVSPLQDYDFSKANPIVIKGQLTEPGFMRIKVNMPQVTNFIWSVAVSPEKIRPGLECPPDFDEFWEKAIARYDSLVPEDVQLELLESLSTEKYEVFKVSLSTIEGRKLFGTLTRPRNFGGCVPIRFESQGAGPASYSADWHAGYATLCMSVHTYEAPFPSSKAKNNDLQKIEDMELFRRFPTLSPKYQVSGIAGEKEDYFYYSVILATRRVYRWLVAQPWADKKKVVYRSTSQGGAFGLYMSALCPEITQTVVYVPALTDLCGYKAGRMSGWPRLIEEQLPENKEQAEKNAGYYDAANFAARIKCPIRVAVGFTDGVCPPCAVYAAYNQLKVKDREIWHGIGMPHLVTAALYARGEAWLNQKRGDE